MIDFEDYFSPVDSVTDEIIRLQTELTSRIALGPDNGGTGEHEKVAYVRTLLEALGPDFVEEYRAPDDRALDGYRPNLVVRWDGSDSESVIWVLCHSDIVPPGDLSLWESDPYRVVVDGDRIIGRGVEDNQHAFVSFYLAMKSVLGSGKGLKRSVGLVFVADEETGSRYGLDYLLKNHKGIFRSNDLIVVPDGGNEEGTMIEVAEKSMLWIKFTVIGEQCHASMPHRGKNSLSCAASMILALEEVRNRFDLSDRLFTPPISTFEPTKIEANVPNVNTIPGRDVFYMDCRILPEYRVDDVIAAVRDIAEEVSEKRGIRIDTDPVFSLDAPEPTPVDAPVVNALKEAIKRVTGKDAEPMGIGGGTVAAFFRKEVLTAAVWSTVS
jgi:succinyl-diaminopimelate desuccinylase